MRLYCRSTIPLASSDAYKSGQIYGIDVASAAAGASNPQSWMLDQMIDSQEI